MSVKHIKEEYDRICSTYAEMVETLHEMEQMATENIVSPEQVENIKKIVDPMKNNKARWDYMMFLLNLPNKKEKRDYYIRKNGKIVENFNEIASKEASENQSVVENMGQAVKELKNE